MPAGYRDYRASGIGFGAGNLGSGRSMPSAQSNPSAVPASGRKVSASVPVSRVCAGSRVSAANRAARCSGSRCTAGSSSSSSGAKPLAVAISAAWPSTRPTRSAFCCPVLACAADSPDAASASRKSARMRADRGPPRCGVGGAAGSQRRPQPVLRRQCGTLRELTRDWPAHLQPRRRKSARGTGCKGGVQLRSQCAARRVRGNRVARHHVLDAVEPDRVGPQGQKPVALGHRGFEARHLPCMGGLQRVDEAGRESAAGRKPAPGTADPSAASARPPRRAPPPPPGCAGRRRRAGMPGAPPRRPATSRCRCRAARRWSRTSRPPPSDRRRHDARVPIRARRAIRGPEPAAKALPAGSSCRCRSARRSRPRALQAASSAPNSCENQSAAAG